MYPVIKNVAGIVMYVDDKFICSFDRYIPLKGDTVRFAGVVYEILVREFTEQAVILRAHAIETE